ncbi:MAG: TonB family protein [Novosphingobium sp.]
MRYVPIAIALSTASPVLAAQPVELAPATPWKLDIANNQCTVERSFGLGDDAVTIVLVKDGGPEQLDAVFFGNKVPKFRGNGPIGLALAPEGLSRTYNGISSSLKGRPERVVRLPDTGVELFNSAVGGQDLSLAHGDEWAVTLRKTGIAPALRALDSCYDQLLESWGVDPKASTRLAVPPRRSGEPRVTNPGRAIAIRIRVEVINGSPSPLPKKTVLDAAKRVRAIADFSDDAWVTPNDYPTEALRTESSGKVVTALSLDQNGKVSACRIAVNSGTPSLDSKTCEVFTKRARFTPAQDQAGNPVTSTIVERVNWVIPRD